METILDISYEEAIEFLLPRHYSGRKPCVSGAFSIKTDGFYVERSPKHRYVYFCTKSKRLKREWMNSLRYPVLPYPKGDNSNYELGRFIGKTVVDLATGERTSIMNDRRIDVTAGQDFLF